MRKKYVLLLCLILAMGHCVSIAYGIPLAQKEQDDMNQRQLQHLEYSMDRAVDACDDFYAYACGGWPSYHRLNDEYWDTPTMMEQKFDMTIRNMLFDQYPDDERLPVENQSYVDKAYIYYQSCKNTEIEAFQGYYCEIKPGLALEWPLLAELRSYKSGNQQDYLLPSESVRAFDIFSLLGRLFSYGLNDVLLHLDMPKQLNAYSVFGLRMPEPMPLCSDLVLEEFFNFAQLPQELRPQYEREFRETQLKWDKIFNSYAKWPEIETLSYAKLKQSYPLLARLFQMLIPSDKLDDEMLISLHAEYIRYFYNIKWQPRQIREISNYIMLKFFQYLRQNSIRNCGEALRKRMPLAVDYLYYQRIFLPQAKEFNDNTQLLKQQLADSYRHVVKENYLGFTDELLELVESKLASVHINVGNLPPNVSDSMLEDFYRHLPDLDINNFYKNDLLLRKHSLLTAICCPQGMSCSARIGLTPIYVAEDDMLVVPMPALMPPMHHSSLHPIFTISMLGPLWAGEFTNAIDYSVLTSHRKFKHFFTHIQNNPKVRNALDCLEHQESSDSIDDRLADLVGARVAFDTYQRHFNKPINFTDISWQRLFFLNFAQYFCGRPDGIHFADHDWHETRLLGVAMNMQEFASSFECPAGSRLNPRRKCRFY